MAGISKEIIEEILVRTDIENLISGYVNLRRTGDTFKGLCPFHSEKTPSFVVYPKTASFYCFGCGMGGDAVTFAKQIERLDYPDALAFLARRVGINILPSDARYRDNQNRPDRDRILKMNADAAKFFHKSLMADNPKAKEALAYFTDKRKLSVATIRHFGLGYAPDSFDAFSGYMRGLGYSYDELTSAFLCGKSESGKYYDAFRDRVMFPIIDVAGNVIAFGGRTMKDDVKPKYKNSSDTPVFKKSRNLFALNFARHASENAIVLCEGYMDVIALHAAGITNAVATLGTAITAEQARLLSRYTKKVIISYDADEAGQKAAARALRIISEVGLDVRVLSIPGSKDPDEYIKAYGSDKFRALIEGAKTGFEYKLDGVLSRYDISVSQDKVNAIGELEKEISEVYSEAERDVYIQIVASRLGVDAAGLKNDIKRMVSKNSYRERKNISDKAIMGIMGFGDKVNPDFVKSPAAAKNEEAVLGLLLLYDEHKKRVIEQGLLCADDFYTDFGKRIFEFIEASYRKSDAVDDLNEIFSPEEVGRITKMKISRMSLDKNGDEILDECIKALRSAKAKSDAKSTQTFDELTALIDSLRSGSHKD